MPVHDDVIKWKHSPRHWPFVRGIHRFPVNSLNKGQWRGALMFSLICVWINGWLNNREAGDLRRYRTHYDVTVMVHWKPSVVIMLTLVAPRVTITTIASFATNLFSSFSHGQNILTAVDEHDENWIKCLTFGGWHFQISFVWKFVCLIQISLRFVPKLLLGINICSVNVLFVTRPTS